VYYLSGVNVNKLFRILGILLVSVSFTRSVFRHKITFTITREEYRPWLASAYHYSVLANFVGRVPLPPVSSSFKGPKGCPVRAADDDPPLHEDSTALGNSRQNWEIDHADSQTNPPNAGGYGVTFPSATGFKTNGRLVL